MKKKVLLVLVAMMAVTTGMSQTYDFSAVAPSGQTLYYSINGDVVSVVSGDVMPTGNLVIPDTVTYMGVTFTITAIGASAFYNCSGITSVVIPSTIITIGNKAFQRCNGITSITFSEGITTIGQDAFRTCNGLTSVTIPYSVSSIGNGAFQYSSGLTSIIIPSNSTTIGHYAFKGCSNLSSVTIMGSISQGSSFELCDNITYLNYDNRANTPSLIPHSNLQKVVVGNNVSSIPSDAFNNATNLSHVLLGSSVSSIGENAFRFCTNLDTIVAMPATAPTLGTNAFQGTPADKVVLTTCNANYATAWGTDGFVYGTFDGFSLSLSSNNPDYGSATFLQTIDCNQTAIIQATPAQNCTFTGWSDGNTDNPRTITLLQNTTLMANFAYTSAVVILQSADETMGTVSGGGTFNIGDTTTITATAAGGYQFDHWSDNNTDNPRTLTVTQDTSLVAYFVSATSLSVEDSLFNVVANNAMGSGAYASGSTAIVFALPQVDLKFAGWSDGEIANPRYIVVTSDTTLMALYRAPDTVRVYDTTTVFDTVINIVYDTTRVYDTMFYVNIDTLHHYYYDTTRIFDTMVYVNIDTLNHYYYDTTTFYDTVVNIVYDTTEYNHYYYDTTHVYDTLVVLDTTIVYDTLIVLDTTTVYDTMVYVNVDTLHHYYYDTTRVFDTLVYVNIDTLYHNYYDTTRVYNTLVVLDTTRVYDTVIHVDIDTLHHYYYDTTRIFDTIIFVNVDTLNHYYYDTTTIYDTLVVLDTTRVFDTMVYVNIDTLHHYYYDTTRVFDTLVYIDTVHHYFFDSTMVYDTVVYVHVDTLHHYHYDTTRIADTLLFYDTTSVTHYVFDSTWVFDSVWVIDTVWVFDTLYFFDTIYIEVPVQGVAGVETINVKVYTSSTQIIVEGAQGMAVRLYDINGRLLATKIEDAEITYFYVQTSGTYLVRVGDLPARRVVVIR